MIKVTYIISDIDKALAFEWVADYIDNKRFELSFILLNPGSSFLHQYLQNRQFEVHTVQCIGKKDWLPALLRTYHLLRHIRPDAVHCHLINANAIGLVAAKLARIEKRIYTRHHSSLHHVYFPKGVWWDKLSNKLATHIIAISGIVQQILVEWEGVPPSKVHLIPHGFLLDLFTMVEENRITAFKEKHHLQDSSPVIGVISRFTEWKGVQYIIPAFKEVLTAYPAAILLLLNAKGDFEGEINKMLWSIPEKNYRLIPFEMDIAAAYHVMDVFVHVPIDEHSEAFGQIYVEALAAGVPSVFTRSGIANEDFFCDAAQIVPHKDAPAIGAAIINALQHPKEGELRKSAGKLVAKEFGLPTFIQRLEKLYSA